MTPMDFASEVDRCWFKQNPGAKCFLRPTIPGEWGPFNDEVTSGGMKHVLVVQFFEGARVRQPMRIYAEGNGLPTELMWLDSGERWRVMPSGEVVPKHLTTRPAWQALLSDDSRRMVEACEGVRP